MTDPGNSKAPTAAEAQGLGDAADPDAFLADDAPAEDAGPPVLLVATEKQMKGARMRVAGLSVAERAILQLAHVGHAQIIIATDGSCALPKTLPDVALVREVRSPADLDALRRELGPIGEFPADVVRPRNRDMKVVVRVIDERSRLQAETAIFSNLKRGNLGLVERHLDKPLSLLVTRGFLCDMPVLPLQVTLAAAALGLVGAILVAFGSHGSIFFGMLLVNLHVILAGCSDELAQVRYQQTTLRDWIDTITGDALDVCLWFALAAGIGGVTGSGKMLGVGLFAALALVFFTAVVYRERMPKWKSGAAPQIVWWFDQGKEPFGRIAPGTIGAKEILLSAGRRDGFVLAWLAFALLRFDRLIVMYALILALAKAGAAAIQLLQKPKTLDGEQAQGSSQS